MPLFDSCKIPHTVTDEDKRTWKHDGYLEKPCLICKKNFIVAISTANTTKTCGSNPCDNGAIMGEPQ